MATFTQPMPQLTVQNPGRAFLVHHEVNVLREDGRFNIALAKNGRVVVTGDVPHERVQWHRNALADAKKAVRGVRGRIPVIVTGTEPRENRAWYLWMLEAADAAFKNRHASRIMAYIRR